MHNRLLEDEGPLESKCEVWFFSLEQEFER